MHPKTVYKYGLRLQDKQILSIPAGCKPRKIMVQNGAVNMWVEVDPNKPPQATHFDTFGTGHTIPDDKSLEYVDSYMLEGGALVFHVYLNRTKTGA